MDTILDDDSNCDTTKLPDVLKWKTGLIIENNLRFDPSACGSGLFISDENTHLKKTENENAWRTCRIMNAGWTQGIHYWSMRINDRHPDGNLMIGIVTPSFDTGSSQYPGATSDSFAMYCHNGCKYNGGSAPFTSDLPQNGDIIGTLLDLDSRTLTFFKNGKILGTAYGQIPVHSSLTPYFPAIGLHSLGQWISLIKTVK